MSRFSAALITSTVFHLLLIAIFSFRVTPMFVHTNSSIQMSVSEEKKNLHSKTESQMQAAKPIKKENALESEAQSSVRDKVSESQVISWALSNNASPVYPRQSRIRGEEGKVLIRVHVLANGFRSGAPKLSQSSGYKLLDQAALEAVEKWKFPALNQAMDLEVPISFRLD